MLLVQAFCGIDWAEDHYDMALVDQAGVVLAERRINYDWLPGVACAPGREELQSVMESSPTPDLGTWLIDMLPRDVNDPAELAPLPDGEALFCAAILEAVGPIGYQLSTRSSVSNAHPAIAAA